MNSEIKDQLLAIAGYESNIDVEIDQTKYPKPDWAITQIVRSSGLVENICKHGIGHPSKEWLEINDPDDERGFGVHGCDGCCMGDDGKHLREMVKIFKREKEKKTEPYQELWDEDLRKKIRELDDQNGYV